MRAHTGNILSPSVWKPRGHHAITHFYGDLFCSLWKWLMAAAGMAELPAWGVWGVCGWKTAVNCIDKKPRATIWAAGVQYEGWLIDWDPGVMQAEGHKHTNTLRYLCYTNRRSGCALWRFNQNNDFQLTSLSVSCTHTLLQLSPLWLGFMVVVSIFSLDWITEHFISQFNQWERRGKKREASGWIQGPSVAKHIVLKHEHTHKDSHTNTQCHQLSFHCLILLNRFLSHHLCVTFKLQPVSFLSTFPLRALLPSQKCQRRLRGLKSLSENHISKVNHISIVSVAVITRSKGYVWCLD